MREAFGTGATTELAQADAARQLGMDVADVQFEVLELPEKKILGIFGGKPARVRAFVEEEAAAEPAAPAAPVIPAAPKAAPAAQPVTLASNSAAAQAAVNYLRDVLRAMGAEQIEITAEEKDDGAELTIAGADAGIVIGHHGETLGALQYLTGLVANHAHEHYYRITLNTGNYREKREQTLQNLARRMAAKAVSSGRRQVLEPMNPYERRIIHTAVQQVEGATSWSEGVDMNRHVVIGPADGGKRPSRPPRSGSGGYRGGKPRYAHGGNDRGGSRGPRPTENRENRPSRPAAPRAEISDVAPRPATTPVEVHTAPKPTRTETDRVPLYGRIDVKK